MKDTRVISKYPNRRLYDARESRYIKLSDIRQLVVNGEKFEVIDKKTGEDITRIVLLHVITEHEESGEFVISEELLARIIRAYDRETPKLVLDYLEQTLSLLLEQQQKLRESLQNASGSNPLAAVTGVAQKNVEQILELQKQLLRSFQVAPSRDRDARPADIAADECNTDP